ncbi:MAG TPA: hypothetical protein VGQ06_12560 [Gemmatimonadales bacterium]|nr:hypothetical protein [Gemmatimonadales bacterium]
MAVTTDFRDLFAEVLSRHLGASGLDAVFPGHAVTPARFPGAIRGRVRARQPAGVARRPRRAIAARTTWRERSASPA